MNTKSQPSASGPNNRWRARLRHGHKWAGVIAGLFLLVTGASGIVLNYRQPIFSALGMDTGRNRERDASPLPASTSANEPSLTTAAGIAGGMVDFAGALALARAAWGDVPLDRIEIRAGGGTVTLRFRNEAGAELWVDAADGRHLVKGAYEHIGKPDRNGQFARTTDWGKFLIDLHTGRIGGSLGKAIISTVAALLLFLSASGFYLWLKPLLRGRGKM